LTEALPELKTAGKAAMLLATGTAVRILMDSRIKPDLVISIDPYEANLAHFQGWDTSGIPLVYYHRIHRGVVAGYKGLKFCFSMQEEPQVSLSHPADDSNFREGGSVAFSALQLAHYLEANPIIFVGQDFAFSKGHSHAAGSIVDQVFGIDTPPPDGLTVPGVDGSPVQTSRIYYSYLLYMQDYLLDFGRRNPGVRHINTSRIGARIHGMEYSSLEAAIAGSDRAPGLSAEDVIGSALQKTPRVEREAMRSVIHGWQGELDRLMTQAQNLTGFDPLFSGFKQTSLYAQAPSGYDDVHYLYETRYKDTPRNREFSERFMSHLHAVQEELHRIELSV
jgi:hypothetical protein